MHIDLTGYAGDCTITGKVDLDGLRLSDALDRLDTLSVSDATLESLADGRQLHAGDIVLERDDLFAVEGAGGARGEGQRRVRMVRHLVHVRMGPYTCFGELHALPGVPPLRALMARRTMVPLTNCLLAFERAGREEVRRLPLLIVNGQLIDLAEEPTSDKIERDLATLSEAIAPHPQAVTE